MVEQEVDWEDDLLLMVEEGEAEALGEAGRLV